MIAFDGNSSVSPSVCRVDVSPTPMENVLIFWDIEHMIATGTYRYVSDYSSSDRFINSRDLTLTFGYTYDHGSGTGVAAALPIEANVNVELYAISI